jgi:hypothetical protein
MNMEWIEDQFCTIKAKREKVIERPIIITTQEVIDGMKSIGKNKAPSIDGIMDIVFQK